MLWVNCCILLQYDYLPKIVQLLSCFLSFDRKATILCASFLFLRYTEFVELDASSAFQDSLPVTSDQLLEMLTDNGFFYQRFDHIPLRTVSDSKQVRDGFLSTQEGGGHIKNLYLRDKKKNNFLLVLPEDAELDLKTLSVLIGSSRLSFGSENRLFDNLGVRPGAVTPLAMINGAHHAVNLYMDSRLRGVAYLYMHPLVNDRTVAMKPTDVEAFLKQHGVTVNWINI